MDKKIIEFKGIKFEKWIDNSEIQKQVQRLADQITVDYKDKQPLFVGILNGAFVFMSDLVRKVDIVDSQVEFSKISSYSGTSSTGEVKELIGMKTDIKDRHVIIVEDIVDTGKSMAHIIPELLKKGPKSIELAALFFKKECCVENLNIKYVGLEIPNKFIIGYGLDIDEYGRQLNDIWVQYKGQ